MRRADAHLSHIIWALLVVLPMVVSYPPSAHAYTTESPEVKAMVNKALKYLEDQDELPRRLGGKSLIGLALVKGNRPQDHPKIQEAVRACQKAAKNIQQQARPDILYDLGIAIIFLCELDAELYRAEINSLMTAMINWQKAFGGWGYIEGHNLKTGDTSMTQYAVLAMWTADRTRAFEVPIDSAVKVCNWLIRTQDVSGGWGYQGKDPGSFQRVPQLDVQHSLSAAGVGSVYVCADLLRLVQATRNANAGLPPALRIVRKEAARPSQGPLTDDVSRDRLRNSMAGGDQWFAKNFDINNELEWVYYYMYALERYQSFKELTSGVEVPEPQWYNVGVEYLKRYQREDGAWSGEGGPPIDTCFGILFLTRGTKKSIAKAAAYDGRLRGGRGLPTNTADVVIGEDGQIVKTPFQGQAESLLSILEAGGNDDIDLSTQEIQIQLSSDPKQRERELIRLRRLVKADEYIVRLTAIKALHETRDLDNVPVFIFALGDPDPRIVRRARNSLRLLSRKISGFGLNDDPSGGEKLNAIENWKDWYLTIRPDAQFLN